IMNFAEAIYRAIPSVVPSGKAPSVQHDECPLEPQPSLRLTASAEDCPRPVDTSRGHPPRRCRRFLSLPSSSAPKRVFTFAAGSTGGYRGSTGVREGSTPAERNAFLYEI